MKQLAVLIAFSGFLALLSGCATGIKMTGAEQAACEKQSCSAWTVDELRALATSAFRAGYANGYQAGKELL